MVSIDVLITEYSRQARAAYVRERRLFEEKRTGVPSRYEPSVRWDGEQAPSVHDKGRRDRFGRNCKPVWPQLAEFAIRENLNIVDLIEACFAFWVGREAPNPPDCKTPYAIEVCKKKALRKASVIRTSLHSEQQTMRTELHFRSSYILRYGWTDKQVVESIIRDLTLCLSPLFRVIAAVEYGCDDLARQFTQSAVDQYHRARVMYDNSLWAELIPDLVRRGADQISSFSTTCPGGVR